MPAEHNGVTFDKGDLILVRDYGAGEMVDDSEEEVGIPIGTSQIAHRGGWVVNSGPSLVTLSNTDMRSPDGGLRSSEWKDKYRRERHFDLKIELFGSVEVVERFEG